MLNRFLILSVSAAMAVIAPAGVSNATEVETGTSTQDHSFQIIEGGEVQHMDPAAYNYVPQETGSSENTIQPRSATGYQSINGFGFSYKGINYKVTTGEMQHRIIGSGNYIETEGVQYRVPSTICNWRVDYQNRNGGKIHRTFVGKKHTGCGFGVMADTGPRNVHVKSGSQQCARLFIADKFRGEQCHHIG